MEQEVIFQFLFDLIHLLYFMRGLILEIAGCTVYEDLSATCEWGSFDVPW